VFKLFCNRSAPLRQDPLSSGMADKTYPAERLNSEIALLTSIIARARLVTAPTDLRANVNETYQGWTALMKSAEVPDKYEDVVEVELRIIFY
jgi:hypothetical protein